LSAGAALLEHGKPVSCMGVDFRDYDNDGLPDISVTALAGETFPLFHNDGKGFFTDVTFASGLSLASSPKSGWSNGHFDSNNDGRMDVVVTALGEPLELWENASPKENHWLLIKLIGTRSNRDGIGTRIRIGSQSNSMTTSVGYASSSHHGVHFGLGKADSVDKIEIFWPSRKG